jgi:DMSO reductase anchor subunit
LAFQPSLYCNLFAIGFFENDNTILQMLLSMMMMGSSLLAVINRFLYCDLI